MKTIYSALLAGALVFAGAPHATAATPPPSTPIQAMCAPGFAASPATYTLAQLNSGLGVKYMCWKSWPGPRPPYFRALMKCSPKFSPSGGTVAKGKAIYYCTSRGHIR